MMSCTEPGSASETRSGNPSGASTASMSPPWASEAIRRLGAREHPYPRIGALIGADALAEVLLQVLDALSLFLGHGLCGTFFMATKNLPP
jgi:hypothetical protein